MNQFSFIKVASAVPELKVADPAYNAAEIIRLIGKAADAQADVILFPELSVTGYSCADLFMNDALIQGAEHALSDILAASAGTQILIAVGLPVSDGQHLYNCAVLLQNGIILGVVPKAYLPNYGEFYEQRWFFAAQDAKRTTVTLCGQAVPFGTQIFTNGQVKLAVEICEDLWVSAPPSADLTRAGAEIILNLSASNAVIGKQKYRRLLVQQRSFSSHCAYVYTSAGAGESTTDTVYCGHVLTAENGAVLLDEQNLSFESAIYYTDIDLGRIRADRRRSNTFMAERESVLPNEVSFAPFSAKDFALTRRFSPQPFIPAPGVNRDLRFEEIYNILSTALAKRLRHTGAKTAVIGISGGLDSTLALLITARAMDILKKPRTDILAVTMPGFGTTGRTLQNAQKLMQLLGTTIREIRIKDACLQHFKDIGHDPSVTDVTYENTQARERTQILMDLANQAGGMVIGTGDLSELALGWATYAGDHISMYGVNAGVPKTLVRHLVDWIGRDSQNEEIRATLQDVLETPVSPELLPMDDDGEIAQKTEEILGDYILHDFFLYYFLRFGYTPAKILFLACHAFKGKYDKAHITDVLRTFIKRFFQNQFKRSCLPDGPKIGSVTLSPRADFRMPSDASAALWLHETDM